MMQFKEIDKILILGRSGCGKSYLGKIIQKAFPRKFIFDSLHEYESSENDISNFSEFSSFVVEIENNPQKYTKFTRVIRFSIDEENREEVFNQMIRVLYHIGNLTIVIEEVQNFCSTHGMPEFLKFSMTTGRHKNLSFIMTTQRPALLHKTILSQCTHVFCGSMIDKNDLQYVAKFMGKDTNDLSTLKDRNFLWYNSYESPHVRQFSTIKK